MEVCEIVIFVKKGWIGLGIGIKFFVVIKVVVILFGYSWINVNICLDNDSGLVYYIVKGFKDYDC